MTQTNPSMLQGIGRLISKVWGVDLKPIDETLEEKINKRLAEEREKIRPSREDIDTFSWITGDTSPIHRLTKRARKAGFQDIPLMGSHVAAYGEQFVEGVAKHMREYWGADIKIIGQENRFREALYPGERVLWQVKGYKEKDRTIELFITGSVKERQIVTIKSRLGTEYPIMPQIAGPIYSERYLIEDEHLEEYYNCVGAKSNGKVPNMLPAAFVPATLLNLLKTKTQTTEGMNLIMNFDFLKEANPGTLQVDIFPPRKPTERKDNFIYKFTTVVSQNTNPITYGEIVSSAPYKIEFNSKP